MVCLKGTYAILNNVPWPEQELAQSADAPVASVRSSSPLRMLIFFFSRFLKKVHLSQRAAGVPLIGRY